MLIHHAPVVVGCTPLGLFHDGVNLNTVVHDAGVGVRLVTAGGRTRTVHSCDELIGLPPGRRSKVYGEQLLVRTYAVVDDHPVLDSFLKLSLAGPPACDSYSPPAGGGWLAGGLGARPLVIGPDGTHVDLDGVLRLPSGDRPPTGHDLPGPGRSFDVRPGLVAYFDRNSVRLVSFDLSLDRTVTAAGWVRDVAISPDLRTVLVLSFGHVELVDVRSGRRVRSYSLPGLLFRRCAWSPDGLTFAAQGVNATVVMDHD